MGRGILIVVIGAGIIFSLASRNMSVTNKEEVDNASTSFEYTMARNIAKSGVDLCVMQLDSSRWWRAGYTNFSVSQGTLTATVSTIDSENVLIRSTGTYGGKPVRISCTVYLPGSLLPAAFNYALASDGPLRLNGTVDVLLENPSLPINANVHSNTAIATGTQVRIHGFGTSGGSITANPLSKLPEVFEPNYNPNGAPDFVQNTSKIAIPDLNVDAYKAIADETHEGDLSVSGNASIGSLGDPRIIWVGGNLTLSGGVNLSGSGVYVVKGNITISGNVEINNGVGAKSALAFYSKQSITINGNPSIEGQFYAKDDFVANGNPTITGNVIVRNSEITVTTLNGTATIRYRKSNELLTTPFWAVNPRPNITSYWE